MSKKQPPSINNIPEFKYSNLIIPVSNIIFRPARMKIQQMKKQKECKAVYKKLWKKIETKRI